MEGWNWLVCVQMVHLLCCHGTLYFHKVPEHACPQKGASSAVHSQKLSLCFARCQFSHLRPVFSMFPLRVDSLLLGFILSSSYDSQTFSAFPPLPSYPLPSPLFPFFSALTVHSGFGYLFPYLQII